MSIGTSGRIVIEVEPAVKRRLYALLAAEGMSLKDWFLKNAAAYLDVSNQVLPSRPHAADDSSQQAPQHFPSVRVEK